MKKHVNNGYPHQPKSVAGITFEAQVVIHYGATENARSEGENAPYKPDFDHEVQMETLAAAIESGCHEPKLKSQWNHAAEQPNRLTVFAVSVENDCGTIRIVSSGAARQRFQLECRLFRRDQV